MKLSLAHCALALFAQFLSQHQADAFVTTTTGVAASSSSKVLAFTPRTAAAASPSCLYATVDKNSNSVYANPGDNAADDDGPVTTKEEQEDIDEAIRNVLIPEEPEIKSRGLLVEELDQDLLKAAPSNKILFGILKFIIEAGKMDDPVKLHEKIDFVGPKDVRKCMFFYVKDLGATTDVGTMLLYKALELAPPLNLEIDTEDMTGANYAEYIGDKAIPLDTMMEVSSPLKCFLENAPAFCKPIEEEEHQSVCDLDYLAKYPVKVGTPYRYGGKAIVEKGEIVAISGVKKDEADFDTKLNIFLASFAVHVVLVRHAVMGHLAMYQKYMMKLTTDRSNAHKSLWNEHKSPNVLMKALTPRNTNLVNYNIQLLIGPGNSLVGRATSFTNHSLTAVNIDKYKEYSAMNPDTIVEYIGSEGSKEWNSACQKSWKSAKNVVNFICRDISSQLEDTEDLLDLAMLLWTGTFFHGFIGDFQLDNVIRGNLPFLVTGEKHQQTVAYGTLSTTIGTSTAQRTMDMQTLRKFFETKEDRNAWEQYHDSLAECAKMTGINGFSYDGYVYNAIDF